MKKYLLAFLGAGILGMQAQSLIVSSYAIGECWDCAGGSNCPKPIGIINGSNAAFTLRRAPMGQAAVDVFLNGIRLRIGADYGLSGQVLTLLSTPQSGDTIDVRYRGNYAANVPAQ